MAYNLTSKSATEVIKVGIVNAPREYWGVVALSGGTATVTIPGAKTVLAAWVGAQSANAAYVASSAANAFTITGTSSDVIMWRAFAK